MEIGPGRSGGPSASEAGRTCERGTPLPHLHAMITIDDPDAMQKEAEALRMAGKRLAVVPTMGALHEGHLALVREAKTRADIVIVTVFVNPAQFGPGEDFDRYPRDLSRDAALTAGAGAAFFFAPGTGRMYGPGFQTSVVVEHVTRPLEGASRPGHFRGVATVVAKLFHITKPHVAVFGQKDAQQVVVIRRMIRDLNFDVELVVVPTVREKDGLAMSSRNAYLTREQRAEAPVILASLQMAETMIRSGERASAAVIGAITSMITSRSTGLIDYVSVADGTTLEEAAVLKAGMEVVISLAVRFGPTRLIDNVHMKV